MSNGEFQSSAEEGGGSRLRARRFQIGAGLIDVALSCGMRELRLRKMSAGERLSELDPDDGIAALLPPVQEELVVGSAAWLDDFRVV